MQNQGSSLEFHPNHFCEPLQYFIIPQARLRVTENPSPQCSVITPTIPIKCLAHSESVFEKNRFVRSPLQSFGYLLVILFRRLPKNQRVESSIYATHNLNIVFCIAIKRQQYLKEDAFYIS